MSTPFRSRSSVVDSEYYFVYLENMERCQRESDRNMQSLIRQTRRLKEENEELHAQMSSTSLSQSQQPQSQRMASRQTDETFFPRNVEFSSSSHTTRFEKEFSPAYQVQQDESTDFTRVSTKRRRDRRSRLSDAMRAQLGPQTPGIKAKPCMVETLEARLGPSITAIMLE